MSDATSKEISTERLAHMMKHQAEHLRMLPAADANEWIGRLELAAERLLDLQQFHDWAEPQITDLKRGSPVETSSPQAPIVKVIVGEDDSIAATMYAPCLPPGEHDLYCEPPTPGGQKVPFLESREELIDQALAAMSAFHSTFEPADDPELTPCTSPAAFREFVDEHARLMRLRRGGKARPPEHAACTCPSCAWCGEGEHRPSEKTSSTLPDVLAEAIAKHGGDPVYCTTCGQEDRDCYCDPSQPAPWCAKHPNTATEKGCNLCDEIARRAGNGPVAHNKGE